MTELEIPGMGKTAEEFLSDVIAISDIVEVVRRGTSVEIALQAAGVPQMFWRQWEKLADVGEQPYMGFFASLRQAEAFWIRKLEQRAVSLAAAGSEKMLTFILERKHPGYRKDVPLVEVNQDVSTTAVTRLSTADAKEIADMAAEKIRLRKRAQREALKAKKQLEKEK